MDLFKAVYALIKNSDHANGCCFSNLYSTVFCKHLLFFFIYYINSMGLDKRSNKFRYY